MTIAVEGQNICHVHDTTKLLNEGSYFALTDGFERGMTVQSNWNERAQHSAEVKCCHNERN